MLSVYFAPSQINVQKCMDNSSHLLLMLIWSLCSLCKYWQSHFFYTKTQLVLVKTGLPLQQSEHLVLKGVLLQACFMYV